MELHKRILGRSTVQKVVCIVAAGYLKCVYLTGRWTVQRDPEFQRLWNAGDPFILCFWHGRLLMMPFIWGSHRVMHMLMSGSRDGQLITRTVAHFGIRSIVGSRNRSGAASLRKMVRTLRNGEFVGITPDGSRGPRMRVSDGCVETARMAGAPLVPITFSCSNGKALGTWDRLLVPSPFSRGVFIWGEPEYVQLNADRTALPAIRERLENKLNAISEEADQLMGRAPIRPAAREG